MIDSEEKAFAEARSRWGDHAYVRDRVVSFPLIPRFVVGARHPVEGSSATVHGEGNTWQEAFDEATSRAEFLRGAWCSCGEVGEVTPIEIKTQVEVIPPPTAPAKLRFAMEEIPGVEVYEDTSNMSHLIPVRDLVAGQQVIVPFFQGMIRMEVREDENGWLITSGDLEAVLVHHPKYGWLASGFINLRGLRDLCV